MKNPRTSFGLLLGALLIGNISYAQTQSEVKATLFNTTDRMLSQVQAEQGNLLAPTSFRNAMNKYRQATESFNKGKKIKEIESKLSESRVILDRCLEIAKIGKVAFATTLKAREDALMANAPEYANELFESAEAEFISAAKRIERNDIKGAKKRVNAIDTLYRKAELNAIKASIIGSVRNLIGEAKRMAAHKVAPITFANAQKLLFESEAILNSNRRSESSAREKAEAAETEAKHAIFLTRQIKWLRKNQNEWEDYFLNRELLILSIGNELGHLPTFEAGMDKPLKEMIEISNILQTDKKLLLQEVEDKNREIQSLKKDLQLYKEKEQGLQAELRDQQFKLELKRQKEELILSVENMFTSEEAMVLRKGGDLIIRLIGLTFASGKAMIDAEFFSLLAKIQRALRKFPNARFSIEGHTDSRGDDRRNENLSYERATAVKKYLVANMGLAEAHITALGYGETRPIASNETEIGRSQNRRIDVVISYTRETL